MTRKQSMPDFSNSKYSHLSLDQIAALKQLYNMEVVELPGGEEGIRKTYKRLFEDLPAFIPEPRYNPDGTRRQMRGYYTFREK